MSVARDSLPPARPGYLVLALIVAWFVGLRTAHEGYITARIAQDSFAGDSLALPPPLRDALVEGISSGGSAALPIGIAQVILGGLLLWVSALALFRGRISVSFAVQVLAANALVAILAHVTGAPVREAMIGVLTSSPELLGAEVAEAERAMLPSAYEWAFLLGLLIHLGVLGALTFAVTRPGARAFLATPSAPHKER